jgi:hypothetical protein
LGLTERLAGETGGARHKGFGDITREIEWYPNEKVQLV